VFLTARQNSPKDFDHDVVLEAVSRRQMSPRSKLLAEATMNMAFIIKADVGGIRIL
jgi:hypothetical protein